MRTPCPATSFPSPLDDSSPDSSSPHPPNAAEFQRLHGGVTACSSSSCRAWVALAAFLRGTVGQRAGLLILRWRWLTRALSPVVQGWQDRAALGSSQRLHRRGGPPRAAQGGAECKGQRGVISRPVRCGRCCPWPAPTGVCGRETALHRAAYMGNTDAITALLKAGADQAIKGQSGYARPTSRPDQQWSADAAHSEPDVLWGLVSFAAVVRLLQIHAEEVRRAQRACHGIQSRRCAGSAVNPSISLDSIRHG
jgi:hypothetical protein